MKSIDARNSYNIVDTRGTGGGLPGAGFGELRDPHADGKDNLNRFVLGTALLSLLSCAGGTAFVLATNNADKIAQFLQTTLNP